MHTNTDSSENAGKGYSCTSLIPWFMALLAFVVVGSYLSRPLYDPDFYWHLKTGQWIWQNTSLPHTDLFGVPPLATPSPRTEVIFTSYWLLQLVMYGFYCLGGMSGIILFRWLVASVCFLICTRWTNVCNRNVAAVIIIGATLLLEYYFIERPQFVSFVCFGIMLVVVFRFFDQRAKSLWTTLFPLSFLMVVWSNMHGGFLIGQAVLIYCVVAEGMKFLHRSLLPLARREYQIFCIALLTALIASFINPNAVNMIKYLPIIFDSNYYVNANNLEELSLRAYFKQTGDYAVLLYIASIVLTFVALLSSRHRKNITWVGILAGTAFMGCQHMRHLPFFLVAALLFMTKYFETECSAIKGRVLLLSMLAVTTVFCIRDEFPRVVEASRSGWVPATHFPVKAADFIVNNNIRGNIYTTMAWGGYLIWRVGPENKIFYDSRTLSVQRAWEYDNSRIISLNQRSYWKGLFNIYDIQMAVLPVYEDDGKTNMLTQSIYADNEWNMVFSDAQNAVFIKKPVAKQF